MAIRVAYTAIIKPQVVEYYACRLPKHGLHGRLACTFYKIKMVSRRTALAIVFLLNVSHFTARRSSHLTSVGVVLSVGRTQRRTVDTVAVVVTSFRTLTASRQPVQRRHALGTETAALVVARIASVGRKNVTRETGLATKDTQRHRQRR